MGGKVVWSIDAASASPPSPLFHAPCCFFPSLSVPSLHTHGEHDANVRQARRLGSLDVDDGGERVCDEGDVGGRADVAGGVLGLDLSA